MMMNQGVMDSPVTLVIKAPNQKYDDQKINCHPNWTVEKLKAHLSDVYPSKPSSKDQRLVYSGKLLLDHFTLKDVLRKQDEYHMLHLVCASRTPPSSPKPVRSRSNKPQESAVAPASQVPQNAGGHSSHASAAENSGSGGGFRQGAEAFPYHQMFMQSWSRPSPPALSTNYYYSPMSLVWWQQLYARQYYMHYHLLAAAAAAARTEQSSAPPHHPDPLSRRPQVGHRGNPEVQMNAQGGEILNEEELNRDWLDWVYTFSRAAVLLSIVYFYSSFSRFVMVTMAMLVLYLHQAGWFPFNLDNELQLPGDRAHQDDLDGDVQNHDLQEMEVANDENSDDDDDSGGGESGEEGAEDPNSAPQAGFLSSTWSFIITFFMSLIPEGPQNAAN
ncbi:homocysteine-responsive endoplasmic reticulum-resident ubiquitin-like domain member 2 protein isoform X2 [Oryzias latipes]|uniref:homocysteine-responsive endoplasmic reticulum-resident ubiquitin-like domain member 2 protein isoform X2 n=1 Tax=Oryzias latipes TaxID=8090 RepID=UPI0005CC6BAD|nr:homocysteine-responsive endoplasmic reticulum-resident ubiquitin-like domain member 2 protein isoform X2 [Oryzias latipes]